jgi:FkbM family methyltransferase
MVRPVLALLRERGIDIKSPHRRAATSKLQVSRRILAGQDVRVAFDCGAHHGRVTRSFLRAFPRATVYAFEPTPATFEILSRNLAGVDRVELVNAAVGAERGTLDLYVQDWEQSNSLVDPGGDAASVKVDVVPLGEFCAERGIRHIDLLKLDVEGYELQVLRGLEPMLRAQKVDVIYTEVRFEPFAPGCTHFLELVGYLRGFGYRFFGFYDTIYKPWLQFDWGDIIMVSERMTRRLEKP